jgi:hypothetical protein
MSDFFQKDKYRMNNEKRLDFQLVSCIFLMMNEISHKQEFELEKFK